MSGIPVPVLGFAAYSGTGKTTLLVRLIPLLAQRGLRIAMIKHAHHDFDTDIPGKDSYELRRAGARQVLVASDQWRALITESHPPREPALEELVGALDLAAVDLVLVEGFRHLPFPKLEPHRAATGRPLLCREDGSIIAVASDVPPDCGGLPVLDINDAEGIADFIAAWAAAPDSRGPRG